MEQLRRGTEQVPSLRFTDGRSPPTALVIGTRLTGKKTEVLVIDPPPDEERPEHMIKHGPKEWEISDSGEFQRIIGMVSKTEDSGVRRGRSGRREHSEAEMAPRGRGLANEATANDCARECVR